MRAELFSAAQMEQHGKNLAQWQRFTMSRDPDRLLGRLSENEKILNAVCKLLTETVKANRQVTPAGEWLLDNFYHIEEQIRTAKRHLPKGYSRQLPRLSNGPSTGLPRVYDLALETISHGDGHVHSESLSRFIAAYQTISHLNLGELWAIPIMLRLALIENLRRVAVRIASNKVDRELANSWSDQMMDTAETDPKNLILVIADMARSNPPMVSSFVAELARRLQGQSAALALPLTWVEQRLSESGTTIEQLVQQETQQQAMDQASISNSIGSLRFLDAMDWRTFVEQNSEVDRILSLDPANIYRSMDFSTRDQYRHIVERLGRRSEKSEPEIAHEAIRLAQQSAIEKPTVTREAHVGFYLLDDGVTTLERNSRFRRSPIGSIRHFCSRSALAIYVLKVASLAFWMTAAVVWQARVVSHTTDLLTVLIGVVAFVSASQLAIALVNWGCTLLVTPKTLPKLDFSKGIPAEARTLVIVPTMLSSEQGTRDLLEALEVRFLANRNDNVFFGLLTDFSDSAEEHQPQDEQLLAVLRQGIEDLNQQYSVGSHLFFAFHRPRQWNEQEKVWMGYERKRGKLADLNALLRGAGMSRFSVIVGDTTALQDTKYVITLDTDTKLPRDTARQLIGAIAHPLNRACFDEDKKIVIRGYGILQPRVMISLAGSNTSEYARLHSQDAGIDPYTRAVSDVYQDLFREGSFIGKGIYDVDAFELSLKDRFPENRILSHDLLEGCYARSGLLTDVQLYEDHPSRYSDDIDRRYRWIRGDWQLPAWLFNRVPGPEGRACANPLSAISRWKIFDNLRRSLSPLSLLMLLILGWSAMVPSWLGLACVATILFLPAMIGAGVDVFRKPDEMSRLAHVNSIRASFELHCFQALFTLSCLPYEACLSVDAILRTNWRLLVRGKGLLEWKASGSIRGNATTLAASYRTMWSASVVALAVLVYLTLSRPSALIAAAPVVALWLASPAIAWWLSRRLLDRSHSLSPEKTIFLRKLARKTWSFFEMLVGATDNWLPPDNYQESPADVVAHRTSPTNIGLALLANLTAYDFGYISMSRLLERSTNTLHSMHGLERHRGHFYNWYDTQTLRPLSPMYVSTVDSGNLAGHLLTLRMGLLALPEQPIMSPRLFDGLLDAFRVLVDCLPNGLPPSLIEFQDKLKAAISEPPGSLHHMRTCLTTLNGLLSAGALLVTSSKQEQLAMDAVVGQCRDALAELDRFGEVREDSTVNEPTSKIPTLREIARSTQRGAENSSNQAAEMIRVIEQLALLCAEFAQMDYDFLFDETRRLLAIGYNVDARRLDASYYDLLASEARLCNFVAIAQGQLPQESWFSLGRLLTTAAGEPILFSWSGSMFEYLMPLLVMPSYENTLLDQTCKAAVKRQIEYGKQRGVPWGVSESGYNTVDGQLNYQYKAFGVPGLGLKRGLAEDLVIAPYATVLALMVAPEEACKNLEELAALGYVGQYGFYEAIDYTPSRVPRGQEHVIVRSFMAHHEGMSFLSLSYLLLDKPMQNRFLADPSFQATILLLQERIPKSTTFRSQTAEISGINSASAEQQAPLRLFNTPSTSTPEVHLLSNGRYHVMMTNSGGGYSRWKDIAITRWREDSTCDNWGTFCYLHDVVSGNVWSNAYQPTLKRTESYEAIFSEARVEYRRKDHDIDTHSEIVVSSEDDIELRRLRVTNRGRTRRVLEITSYAEVVLAPAIAEALHPAFNNLFVQTEIIEQHQAILCNRRPRAQDEVTPWMMHLMAIHGVKTEQVSYETDRLKFIGRAKSAADPTALKEAGKLSGSRGSVLDPIVAIRCRIVLEPEESAIVNIVTGMADTREAGLGLIEKYRDRNLADRVFDLAWTHSQVVLRQINATESDGQLYARLAGSIIYNSSNLRADASVLIKNRRGQSGLWGYAISGDLPIVVLQIEDSANLDLVRQLVQAHAYWRLKGLAVDLVIWNEDHAGYRQVLQEQILGMIAAGIEAHVVDRPGGIFVRPAEQISEEDRILLKSVARILISDKRGTLAEQVGRRSLREPKVPPFLPSTTPRTVPESVCILPWRELILHNGLGGFTPDGREYVITTALGQNTPAPWANVLANPQFGSVISESGAAYTWSENAHEFRVTPWNNDPVTDASGEAFYIRDEESGQFWSPTPLPARGLTPYVSRHGFGYSAFEHTENGIYSELLVYVDKDSPVKFFVLKLRNVSGRVRRLSTTGYVEWVLGDLRPRTAMHVITEIDPKTGALLARNAYNTEFSQPVAFFTVDETHTLSGDRTEFIGRNKTLISPNAMLNSRLSGKVGAALDPCGAIQVAVELSDGQEREIVFKLGVGRDATDATNIVQRFKGSGPSKQAYEQICQYWKHTLGTVNVDTPDPSLNMLVNGWLLYQTIACRLWARSGYYQSGGAYGFRDQLQDVMALLHAEPQLMREQLLRCSSRQFLEGDVQHWWHPPSGRGVRTHCSDDYLWLPLVTCRYVTKTGDTGVLDEKTYYLQGRPVNPEEESYYDMPSRADEQGTLYEHCVRAINHALRFGTHGLPFIGSCDWNDGLNLVGKEGKGESVWLGFFLYDVLKQFADLAGKKGDHEFAAKCESEALQLQHNIEENAWDGNWYRRAYFDDGTPLGAHTNEECQIDSISQSWSVLSGAGDHDRSRTAMHSLDQRLVRREHQLIQLLDPPFDKSALNPGYIKGYVPGVRENGGQYTHGAIWAAMAFAALGDNERAWELTNMINPVNHASTKESMETYKVEPYVVSADVYAVEPHIGRGGWSWYTGSAGWLYRLIVESLLGLRLEVNKLRFAPCLPPEWPEYKIHYRYGETVYHITISQVEAGATAGSATGANPAGGSSTGAISVSLDGVHQADGAIMLIDDRREHSAQVNVTRIGQLVLK